MLGRQQGQHHEAVLKGKGWQGAGVPEGMCAHPQTPDDGCKELGATEQEIQILPGPVLASEL